MPKRMARAEGERQLAETCAVSPSVSLLNPLILVISAHHHASKDGLAFPLAHATREEERQGREDCAHDCGDGRRKLQPTRHSITDSDEGRLFGWPGVLTVGGLACDLRECRFSLRGAGISTPFRPTLNDICVGTYGSLSQDLNSGSGLSPDWFKIKNSDAPLCSAKRRKNG